MTNEQKLNGLIGLLRANVQTAREATMTGAFRKSRTALMNTYNKVYEEFAKHGFIPEGFINLADDNSTLDDIGVLSRNLVAFIESSVGSKQSGSADGPFGALFDDGTSVVFGNGRPEPDTGDESSE